MSKALKNQHIAPFKEFLDLTQKLHGVDSQKKNHEMNITGISDIVKNLKANRNTKMKRIIGGSLIVDIDNKKAIADLMKQKSELEDGIKVLAEQLMHMEDTYVGLAIKIYKILLNIVPEDIIEETKNEP